MISKVNSECKVLYWNGKLSIVEAWGKKGNTLKIFLYSDFYQYFKPSNNSLNSPEASKVILEDQRSPYYTNENLSTFATSI